jgi:hypothetical protein
MVPRSSMAPWMRWRVSGTSIPSPAFGEKGAPVHYHVPDGCRVRARVDFDKDAELTIMGAQTRHRQEPYHAAPFCGSWCGTHHDAKITPNLPGRFVVPKAD